MMAKKKKKSQGNVSMTTPVQALPPLNLLSLRLSSESKGKPTDHSQILLTNEDACRLDILNKESVIVLVQGNDMVEASTICSARILDSRSEPVSSPSSKFRSPSKSTKNLSCGSCNIIPPPLLERLLISKQKKMKNNDNDETDFQKFSSPQASPGSAFSFAKGGGGDLLISPSRMSPRGKKASTPLGKRSENIWVVPIYNSLGQHLLKRIGKTASSISLRPLCDVPQNSLEVIRRLVYTRFLQRYIIPGETINIYFQGKALQLIIDTVLPDAEKSIERLCDEASQLRLENPRDGHDLVTAVNSALQDPTIASDITLFQVIPSTEITIVVKKIEQEREIQEGPFVAGIDHVLTRVKSTISAVLLHPETFGELKPPRGLLLFGPSGVGKSALARQVTAEIMKEQTEFDAEFCHCASLQSHAAIVGESERILSRMFIRERKTLLVLDDIHFICPRRGNMPGIDRLAATLLALLDGVDSNKNIFLIGTTTDPALLDPALRRPGRLDEEIEVPIPDEKMRKKILKMFLEKLKRETILQIDLTDENIKDLATAAKGFNGADCLLAVKETTRIAFKKSKTDPLVTQEMLKTAISSIQPSTISSISVEVPKVSWDSIGGMDNVKEKIREAIELPLIHADLFAKFNIPSPRGVLLYGPPGCSKTLMARALATEGKMNFLAVRGPELLSKWLGESERALASLFRRARMASPCIIFFDEVDAIASKRGSGDASSGGERILSQLLTELDGIGSRNSGKVVVVAATNRPDLLDHALTRPGRIDRKIFVGLPDTQSRECIFKLGLKDKAHDKSIDYLQLASSHVSGGFSGAEIVAICRDAALLAIEEADGRVEDADISLCIKMKHLYQAIQSTPRNVTMDMLAFYDVYANHNPI